MNELRELWWTVRAGVILAGAGGLVSGALLLLCRSGTRRLLPLQRHRPVPWTGLDVWAAFFIFMLFPLAAHVILSGLGVFVAIYGDQANAPELRERTYLWSTAVAFPLQVAGILGWLRARQDTRLGMLGITTTRWRQNVAAGYLLWLGLTPVALLVFFAVSRMTPVQEHPLTRIARQPLMTVEWVLIFFGAVVVAAVLEELVFRGVLLPWQMGRGVDAQAAVFAIALVAAVGMSADKDRQINPGPALFVVAMAPGYFLIPLLYRDRPPGGATEAPEGPAASPAEADRNGDGATPGERAGEVAGWSERLLDRLAAVNRSTALRRATPALAIYSNALLFAAVHAPAWPAPIALFPLGLGLAWLGYRTQSLVGPVVMHALFNTIPCIVMVLSHAG